MQEIGKILKAADLKSALKAMVWLALNGGMYSTDCAVLKWGDIKKVGRYTVVDTYREKTGIRQCFPLWPETVKALEAWRPLRPEPKGDTPADLVFVTVHGNSWTNETITRDENGLVKGGGETDSVRLLFNRLLVDLKIKRYGVGFGKFRHTHTSAAGGHADANARKVVRGHKIDGIEEHYDFQDVERLKSVTDAVYKALIIPALKSKKPRVARGNRPT